MGKGEGYLFIHWGLVKLKTKKNVVAEKILGIFVFLLMISVFVSQWKGGEESPGGINLPTSENFFRYSCVIGS